MKALVTGAAGFLGFHLARALSRRPDFEVVCVDNFVRGENDDHYAALTRQDNVTACDVDLSDPAAVRILPDDVDYIYHFAALNGTQNFYERPLDVIRYSTLPTVHLIDKYARNGRIRRLIYAGSGESYACTVASFGWDVPTAEDVPLSISDVSNPRWSYAISKMHGEVTTMLCGRSEGLPVTVVRYHNAYGPRMGDKHVIPDFYRRMRADRYELYGFEDTRSFIYVDDAVRATMMVAEAGSCAGEVVNVGSGREIRVLDLAVEMMRLQGIEARIALNPSPEGSVRRRAPDIAKLRRLTGFEEAVSLERGLTATSRFYLHDTLVDALCPSATYAV